MFKLREATINDLETIRAINEDAIPAVNTVSIEEFLWFFKRSLYFKVSVDEKEQVCGFLLVLPADLNYESLNYRWFSKNFSDFACLQWILRNEISYVFFLRFQCLFYYPLRSF